MEAEKKVKVMVGIPRGGMTLTEAIDSQIDVVATMAKAAVTEPFAFMFSTIGRVFVPAARESLVSYAQRTGCDYLLMIDDDMLVPHDIFFRLYKHNVDVVAALAFQRMHPYFPVIYKQQTGYDEVRKQDYFFNDIIQIYPKDTLYECDAVGFGAVLIKMDVLAKMQAPYFTNTCSMGEDILFCYNARKEAGAKIFCDTATKTIHLGSPLQVDEVLFEKTNNIEESRKFYDGKS